MGVGVGAWVGVGVVVSLSVVLIHPTSSNPGNHVQNRKARLSGLESALYFI